MCRTYSEIDCRLAARDVLAQKKNAARYTSTSYKNRLHELMWMEKVGQEWKKRVQMETKTVLEEWRTSCQQEGRDWNPNLLCWTQRFGRVLSL